jgi:cell division protein ZapA
MPLVNVLVNGRAYTIACDEGEEDHLRELGNFVDRRVRELTGSVGQVGDNRLLVMAGLVIADELSDALARLESRDKDIAGLRSAVGEAKAAANAQEGRAAEALETAASRVEAIAVRLARS